MPTSGHNLLDLVVTTLAFGLVFTLWLLGAFVWMAQRSARKRTIEMRLGLREEEVTGTRTLRLWREGREATTVVPHLSVRGSWRQRLHRLRQQAGWQVPVHTLVFGTAGGLTLLFVLAFSLTGSGLAGLGAIVGGFAIFWTWLKQRIAKCNARFERQLADALDLAARSLRAGHPLIGSFQVIAEEIADPVGTLFAEICQQQSLGVPLEVALRRAAGNVANEDMKLFATSVAIQLRTGGDLADMMDRVAAVIRDRIRLAGRVRSLTAQTQLSKRILISLPFIMFAVLSCASPQYLEILYTTSSGRLLLAVGGVMLLTGAWLMNRMAILRY
ncbi:MAG TPA: type II secretion system F family protein [Phycisphaerae bacterium]|jgi:tight adherence protein B|nr:hypothetical protein [Phycisphaerae bacterium]HOJ53590.1 type II secretion system F family protein [Phycisphaerae bacterium]HOL25253.1 type II secretion system F family protein [Phycisphaerae bacterium]HPP20532.1 type II secretion system F family protein [Phycisphaerae bacterium]HPU32250.1 type II secretion system F family protein [Phycisphaerae bacterium]